VLYSYSNPALEVLLFIDKDQSSTSKIVEEVIEPSPIFVTVIETIYAPKSKVCIQYLDLA